MILGMSLATFTLVHVGISLIGIVTGLVVLSGMLRSRGLPGWTAAFLLATVVTSVTGFFFTSERLLPSHIVGVISFVVLAVSLYALYVRRVAGAWRWIYVATALLALYLNVFVLVVQAFVKIAFLKALAPTQGEPPFAIAQGVVLPAFIALGILAVRAFHPERAGLAMRPG
jgi:hypothetical protein